MTDTTKRVNWLAFASYKCRRIVRLKLGGETYAFDESFDIAYSIAHDMQKLLRQTVQITILTDSESMFRLLLKSSTTPEKILIINIRATREAYENGYITNI